MAFSKHIKPVFWSLLIFIIAQCFLFAVMTRVDPFLRENNLYIPPQPDTPIVVIPQPPITAPDGAVTPEVPITSALLPILIYFAVVIVIISVVLFLIPLKALKFVFRALFALLFAWGIFILGILYLPLWTTLLIALVAGAAWFFFPRIWLHNMMLMIALAGVAAIFGRMITPWTAMILLGVLAVYDLVAVRAGYMLWMANKMSQSAALPAFILPSNAAELGAAVIHNDLDKVADTPTQDRSYSVLGGGDIAFPLLLTASVYFQRGGWSAIVIAAFGLAGIAMAYLIQAKVLKGRPMPALPPIAILGLVGLLLVINVFPKV
ncbi:MAG: presenilin family intramembrane aspartyl protease [Dehalococcoidia bacterium]|nr:presenilin family intramembrane aspartyl protease [Dehalococcoidia bacterium]